jgi:hypothetical protein
MTPCSPLSVNRRFGEHNASIFRVGKINSARNQRKSRWQVYFWRWRWRRYVPPNCRLTLNGLHGVISQKMVLFNVLLVYNFGSLVHTCQITRYHNPQDHSLSSARCGNLKRPIHAEVCRKAERPAGNSEGNSRVRIAPMRAPYTQRFARGSGQNCISYPLPAKKTSSSDERVMGRE